MKTFFILNNRTANYRWTVEFEDIVDADIIPVDTIIKIYRNLRFVNGNIEEKICLNLSGIITKRYVVLGHQCVMHYIVSLDKDSINRINDEISKLDERYL